MNNVQLKYTRERINQICSKKEREIDAKYLIKPPTPDEIINKLREGKFTVRQYPKTNTGYNADRLNEYITFDGDEDYKEVQKQRLRALDDLKEQKAQALDELILGDAGEALGILRNLEAKEF